MHADNIFLLPPNKTEAVYFLDSGGPAPGRFARVIVVRGGYVVPDTMEYKVRHQQADEASLAAHAMLLMLSLMS